MLTIPELATFRFRLMLVAPTLVILGVALAGAAFGENDPPAEPLGGDQSGSPATPVPPSPLVAVTQVAFQGYLTSPSGVPTNGTVSILAKLYDAPSAGNLLWSETHPTVGVTNGIFQIGLGSITPLEIPDFTGSPIYLGISVNGEAELPRTRLLASPFAIRAAEADHALTADMAMDGVWSVNGGDIYRSTGNVGIGSSSPSAKLDVQGSAATGLALKVDSLLYVNATTPFVGIGRSTRLSLAERFGIRAPAATGYGGMYVDTQGASALPFYGYATAGVARAWHYIDGASGTWNLNNAGDRLSVRSDGFVGVGRSTAVSGSDRFAVLSPAATGYGGMYIDTQGASAWPFYGYATGGTARAWHYYDGATGAWSLNNGGATRLLVESNGNVGIGTISPAHGLHVRKTTGSGLASVAIRAEHTGSSGIAFSAETTSSDACAVVEQDGTGDIMRGFKSGGLVFQILNNGQVVTPVLQITGGADLVESFDTQDERCEPGTVVVIDEARAGRLRASASAYDAKVAGVVSGAGGIQPGIHMGQTGVASGETPVAMAGRVYVKCSAENGPIRPGDLLTTAGTAGHAMRATDAARANGAVIGKAMSSLDGGTGLVLVLVNLQ